jgi:peroxiredoxin family protein
MNLIEKKMSNILSRLKNEFGVSAVKAEFEAEGTRIDELMRLIELVRKNDLKLGIKIGGCEAIKDLMECKQIGCEYIIAPMVETDYSLSKFIQAKNKIYDTYERTNTDFLVNIETITTFNNLEKIKDHCISYKDPKDSIQGLVFGRVDFSL